MTCRPTGAKALIAFAESLKFRFKKIRPPERRTGWRRNQLRTW